MTRRCPIDQYELVTSLRDEIEIDTCPACRGVWLDRGELEKIVASGSPARLADGGVFERSDFSTPTQPHGGHEIGHQRKSFLSWLFE